MKGELLKFKDVEGYDVYNPTAPFDGCIAARVELRSDEKDSKVMFFKELNDLWVLDQDAPVLDLQDPFVTRINGELVFGGVEVFQEDNELNYRTIFYKGSSINGLQRFAAGPDRMKDIRLVELPEGVGVFTRPQGGSYGKGQIGFMIIDSLDELSNCDFYSAKIIDGQFSDDEWGGANEVHYLGGNKLGVLGHKAYQDKRGKHYYPVVFTYDYFTDEATRIKIIARREDLPPCPSKRSPELDDVLFTGGLVRKDNGLAELIVGVSDACAGKMVVTDPFLNQ
jgi:hypothetical protein